MTELQSKLEELKSFLIDDGYNDSNIVYQTLIDVQKEAINYSQCCTQLKVANTDKINKLNDALKNIEEDEDFRLDDGMEWVKQKSFIEGKINALTTL